jgi:hypothetical protein
MRSKKFLRVEALSLATAGMCWLGASAANAQNYTVTGFTDTFDTSSSVQIGIRNYNPPPITAVFDYGGGQTHQSVSYSSTVDDTGNGGGSVQFTQFMNYAAVGAGSCAFTMDLFDSPGAQVSDISFNIMIDPASKPDAYGGYGYFQIFTRDSGYNDNGVPAIYLDGTNEGSGYEFGDPTYSPTGADPGVWDTINMPFSGAGAQVRGMTLQLYSDAGRNMDGNVIYYIDNLDITYVPEPASLGLLGLSVPALLARRRKAH